MTLDVELLWKSGRAEGYSVEVNKGILRILIDPRFDYVHQCLESGGKVSFRFRDEKKGEKNAER